MRVLIDALLTPGDPRGVGRYVRALATSLAAHPDVTPIVVHGRWHERFFERVTHAGVECVAVDVPASGRLVRHAWHALGLPRAARRVHADVVHLPDRMPPGPTAGPPTVVTMHDVAEHDCAEAFGPAQLRYRRLILGRQLRRAGWFVTPSLFTADRLGELHGSATARTTVVHLGPGIDSSAEPERPPLLQTSRFLLYVGSLQRHKNVPRVVRAFRRLEDAQISLVLVGADHNDTDAVVRAMDGDRRIVRLSAATDGQLAWLYARASGLVFASLYEGFGLPVVEAMSFGCPVVTSDRAALAEVAGEAALRVDPLDELAIHDAMARVLEDGQLRSRLSSLGLQRSAGFSWASVADRTIGAYETVLQAPLLAARVPA